ncbi:TPA: iron-containing alcohol dehydrogenase, partial [Candidatus Micrarchaeota archaeon]|nr:iron-containing alcohol dehydrogenase [Candidatus Micrarchaeota archaeon]
YFGSYSAALARLSFKHVVRYRKAIARRTYEGINVLLEALVTNGIVMGIQHSSRPASGSEHLISHALDYLRGKKGIHGLQVGLGTIVAAYLQGRDWERVRKYLEDVGAPTTAEALGIPEEMMVKAVAIARTLRDRYTILHRLKVDEHLARKALKATEVI